MPILGALRGVSHLSWSRDLLLGCGRIEEETVDDHRGVCLIGSVQYPQDPGSIQWIVIRRRLQKLSEFA